MHVRAQKQSPYRKIKSTEDGPDYMRICRFIIQAHYTGRNGHFCLQLLLQIFVYCILSCILAHGSAPWPRPSCTVYTGYSLPHPPPFLFSFAGSSSHSLHVVTYWLSYGRMLWRFAVNHSDHSTGEDKPRPPRWPLDKMASMRSVRVVQVGAKMKFYDELHIFILTSDLNRLRNRFVLLWHHQSAQQDSQTCSSVLASARWVMWRIKGPYRCFAGCVLLHSSVSQSVLDVLLFYFLLIFCFLIPSFMTTLQLTFLFRF